MSKPSTEADWETIAALARQQIGPTPYGSKERALEEACQFLAKDWGIQIKKQTLRTYLTALQFVDEHFIRSRKVVLTKTLFALPAIAVETLARWHAHDPKGALDAIQESVTQPLSVRDIFKREQAARSRSLKVKSSTPPVTGVRLKSYYRHDALRRLDDFVCLWPASGRLPRSEKFIDVDGDYPTAFQTTDLADPTLRADFIATVVENGQPLRYAFVIVGPYSAPDLYRLKAPDWCLRAFGLTHFHDRVVLLLPSTDAKAAFMPVITWLPDMKGRLLIAIDPRPAARSSK